MTYGFKRGSTFQLSIKYVGYHLHIILTDPITDDDGKKKVIMVNVTSVKDDTYDDTCTLDIGDHESIKHLSYILYGRARIIAVEDLEKEFKSKKLKKRREFRNTKVKEISNGLLKSPETPHNIIKFYRKYIKNESDRSENFNRINKLVSNKIPDGEFKYLW